MCCVLKLWCEIVVSELIALRHEGCDGDAMRGCWLEMQRPTSCAKVMAKLGQLDRNQLNHAFGDGCTATKRQKTRPMAIVTKAEGICE